MAGGYKCNKIEGEPRANSDRQTLHRPVGTPTMKCVGPRTHVYTADTKQGANALAPRACICPRSERPPPGRARGQRCFVSECQVDTRAFPDEARGAIAAADCCGVSPGAAILLRLLVSIVLEPPPCTGILAAMPSALLIWPPRLAWSGVAFMGLPSSTLFTLLVATPTPTTIGIGSVNMPASSKAESGLARAPEAVAERPVPPPSPPPWERPDTP